MDESQGKNQSGVETQRTMSSMYLKYSEGSMGVIVKWIWN